MIAVIVELQPKLYQAGRYFALAASLHDDGLHDRAGAPTDSVDALG